MAHTTLVCSSGAFSSPDLSRFCGLDELGLQAVGQRLEPDRAVLACRVLGQDRWCRRCGCQGLVRGSVVRRLAHEPLGWRPTTLEVRVRRYRCTGCGHVWRQDLTSAAAPRSCLSRKALRWALEAIVIGRLSVTHIARSLGVAWHTANTAVLAEGRRLLLDDERRFDGVRVIGIDEHVWRHTRGEDRYVTVIIDLTPIHDKTGTARLLDMVPGRSKQSFKQWLASQPDRWRQGIKIVAMDWFSGFKTAASEELPHARPVMDPFHVVRLAADAVDECRRRVQQQLHHRRGRSGDPLYGARRTLLTGATLLTQTQQQRLEALFATDQHIEVATTWSVYQRMVSAYRHKDPHAGKTIMTGLIDSLKTGVPAPLSELVRLGRTLNRRRADILAYFDHTRTSNGPTEAINGRLEHLRGSALGFRNLTHYITRSLLETGGFRTQLHP